MPKNNGSRIVTVSLGGLVALALLPQLAAADASTSASADTLQEVVVTSNKLNAEKVLDVPASLQAISGDTL